MIPFIYRFLKNLCTDSSDPVTLTGVDASALYRLAEKHCSLPFLLPYFENQPQFSALKQQTKQMLLSYYQLEHFTQSHFFAAPRRENPVLSVKRNQSRRQLSGSRIPEAGRSESLYSMKKKLFPVPAGFSRRMAASEEPEDSDHHVTYRYTFPDTHRSFTLELHYRIVGVYQFARANELVDEIFSADHLKASSLTLYGQSYPVLPPTENVFYMLHHMLKHYLYSGFGSRLLCDFTLYLKQYASKIDFEKIHSWCQESKIFHLYELILGILPSLFRSFRFD